MTWAAAIDVIRKPAPPYDGEVGLAGARWSEQDHALAGVEDVELSEVLDGSIHMTCQPWPSRS